MNSRDAIRLIKERLGIVEVVRRYVELKPNGSRWVAPCPFHQETKASFFVSEDKGFFYCFGCQASGDLFDFYARINGLDFQETLVQLAAEMGITVEFGKKTHSGPNRNSEKDRSQKQVMLRLHEVATSFYKSCLQTQDGLECRDYVAKRGLSDNILQNFEIGFAPRKWHALGDVLNRGGFDTRLANDAGLLGKSAGGKLYDRFRGRLIFPIKNLSGQVIAFGGRIIDDSDEAKYINSSDTPIYKKGEHLYGLYQARRAIVSKGYAFLTEGYMDVLTLHQYGFDNAVGVLGTALTSEQIKRLAGFASHVVLLFDGDNAGRKAALRSSEMFLVRGLSCRVALMPEGEDIDSLLRTKGPDYFENILASAFEGLDYCMDTLEKLAPKDAIAWAREFLGHLEMPELAGRYVSVLSSRLQVPENDLRGYVALKKNNPNFQKRILTCNHEPKNFPGTKQEEQILIYAVRYPHRVPELREMGADLVLNSDTARDFWKYLETYTADEITHYLTGPQKIFWDKHRGPFAPPLMNGDTELESLKKLLKLYYTANQKTVIPSASKHGQSLVDFEADLEYLRAIQQTLEKKHE